MKKLRVANKLKRITILIVILGFIGLGTFFIYTYIFHDESKKNRNSSQAQIINSEACELVTLNDAKGIISNATDQDSSERAKLAPPRLPAINSTGEPIEPKVPSICRYYSSEDKKQHPLLISVLFTEKSEINSRIESLKMGGQFKDIEGYGEKAYVGTAGDKAKISHGKAIVGYDNAVVVIDIDNKEEDKIIPLLDLIQSKVEGNE